MTVDPRRTTAWLSVFDALESALVGEERVDHLVVTREQEQEYQAEISIEDRLAASIGRQLTITFGAAPALTGVLARVGAGWMLLEQSGSPSPWVATSLADAVSITGAALQARPRELRALTARLGIGAFLRAQHERRFTVALRSGAQVQGTARVVGGDYLELRGTESMLVPVAGIAWVQPLVGFGQRSDW